jgi:putative transposase
MRLRDLAFSRIRYGYRRFHVLLRREGWKVNLKRVHRLNRLEGLSNRKKTPRRKVSSQKRENRPLVQSPNQVWSMDFMSDTLANGQSARILTILDVCTRESIAIWEDSRFSANKVVRVLEEIAMKRGKPNSILVDNGPDFTGIMDLSRPGKPTDNAFIESFNSRVRQECLNTLYFLSLLDAQEKVEQWRNYYNRFHPHSSLGKLAPKNLPSPRPENFKPNATQNSLFNWYRFGDTSTSASTLRSF